MKTTTFTSAVASLYLLALVSSCSDDQMSVSNADMEIKTEQMAVEETGIIYPHSMEFKNSLTKSGEDGFETNWENLQEITLTNIGPVNLPWNETGGASIPFDIRKDIKKEDGWKMLLHTLTDKSVNVDKYIVFYNQRTGIMKVFYYSDNKNPNNSAKWTLKFVGNQTWLNWGVDVAIPTNLGMLQSWTSTNAVQDAAKGIVYGWNCFQIALAYNPNNVSGQYMEILCGSDNTSIAHFFASTYAYSNGTIMTYGSTNKSSTPINKNVGTIIGQDAENYIANNVVSSSTRVISPDLIKKAAKTLHLVLRLRKTKSAKSVLGIYGTSQPYI